LNAVGVPVRLRDDFIVQEAVPLVNGDVVMYTHDHCFAHNIAKMMIEIDILFTEEKMRFRKEQR
jgi:hypothetical protein